jgi:hypothetical protein
MENIESTSKENHLVFSPLVADIFTAMAKQSEAVTNQVFDNQDREIQLWKSRFVKLFFAIDEANVIVDSNRIARELDHFAWSAEQAARSLDSK